MLDIANELQSAGKMKWGEDIRLLILSLSLSIPLYLSVCFLFYTWTIFFCWTSVNKRVPFIFKYIPHSSFECVSDNKFCFVLMNERDLEREREFTKGNNFYIWNGNSDDNIFFKFFMHSCSNDNISKGILNNNKNNNDAERKLWFSMGKTLMRNIVGKKCDTIKRVFIIALWWKSHLKIYVHCVLLWHDPRHFSYVLNLIWYAFLLAFYPHYQFATSLHFPTNNWANFMWQHIELDWCTLELFMCDIKLFCIFGAFSVSLHLDVTPIVGKWSILQKSNVGMFECALWKRFECDECMAFLIKFACGNATHSLSSSKYSNRK